MTEAYVEGFRKAAEAHGVDPEELMKYANPLALLRAVPKAIGAAKAMRAAANLGWSAPKVLSRQGLGQSVRKNISVLGQRADKADRLRKADSLYNDAKSVAGAAGATPPPPQPIRLVTPTAPYTPARPRVDKVREFMKRRLPGYDVGF